MNRKLYWMLGIFIILIIGVSAFLLMRNTDIKTETVYIDVAPSKDNPPPAEPGYKWVWHHNHWDKVKISETDNPGNSSQIAQPAEQDMPVSQPAAETRSERLTYHAELLETNPVEALRLQAEERGHWSTKWIPPFPPDDVEAAAIARDIYLITYYESIDDTNNPRCQEALRRNEAQQRATHKFQSEISDLLDKLNAMRLKGLLSEGITKSEEFQQVKLMNARQNDLERLSWTRVPAGFVKNPERAASYTLLSN